MIEIKELNKKQLLEYIQSDAFLNQADIPITIHRAISQAKNPRLSEEDVLLLLAMDDSKMVGYLGALPEFIFPNSSEGIRLGWLTCLWVSSAYRGQNIALNLFLRAISLWDDKAMASDYVPATKRIYDKTKKFTPKPFQKKGIRLYVQSDLAHILPPKRKLFQKIKIALKLVDAVLSAAAKVKNQFHKIDISDLQLEYVEQVDQEAEEFIKDKQDKELFKRRAVELNWVIQNPWLLSMEQKSELNQKYYFSSTAKNFEFISLKIRNKEGALIAFLIFSKRDQNLKIPYLYHDDCLEVVRKVLNYHLLLWNMKTCTLFHASLAEHLKKSKTLGLYKKEVVRNYMISKPLQKYFNGDYELQDGDGDCVFT